MLSNIEEESAEDAKRILTLLCTAKRPLAVDELIDGIAVELGENPQFNEDSRLPTEDDIRHICPGFIEVDVQADSKETTVRIAHYSVQEYLESDRIRRSRMASFSVGRVEANTEVASICLVYLMDPGLCATWIETSSRFFRKYPFAVYAARNWAAHYHEGSSSDARLHSLAVQLFRSLSDAPSALVSWVNIYKWDGYKRDGLGDRILSPLYLASRLGLDPVVRELASDPAPIPRRHECYGTSLGAAAAQGHLRTVHVLLDYGADINYGGFQGTALHLASESGHIKVVEALLDRGADIEAHDYRGKSPLYNAASNGHEEVVRFLLDRGANINPIGAYETPLESAAFCGREKVVALLLDRGAQANRGRYQLPIEAAREHPEVQQLLLNRGADPVDETPLETAAYCGNIDGIKKHLSCGAPINVGMDRTPLEAAVSAGHKGAVELLLHAFARVDSGKQRTPLEEAVHKGNMVLVKLLIDKGADVNRGIKRTPLEAAADRVDLEMAQLLIDRGADVNLGIQTTPMEAAAQNNRIILYMRANDAAFGENAGSIPPKATADLHIELMRLLLDHGADVNAEGGDARYKELVEAARAMDIGTHLKAASE